MWDARLYEIFDTKRYYFLKFENSSVGQAKAYSGGCFGYQNTFSIEIFFNLLRFFEKKVLKHFSKGKKQNFEHLLLPQAIRHIRMTPKGSFIYDVHNLGGRGVWDFVTPSYKRNFFVWKFCDKGGGGGLKIPFFDGRHLWTIPNHDSLILLKLKYDEID